MKLTIQPHLVQRLIIRGAIPLLQHMPSRYAQGQLYFTLPFSSNLGALSDEKR